MIASASLLTLRVPDFDATIRAAVEPRLAARPVAVVTLFKPLGRVLAASPAARAAGVTADMPYPVARARCPDAAFFVPDKELAGRAFRAIAAKAAEYTPPIATTSASICKRMIERCEEDVNWTEICRSRSRTSARRSHGVRLGHRSDLGVGQQITPATKNTLRQATQPSNQPDRVADYCPLFTRQ